ncbi:MAG TPA: ferredoxin [Streptosporangiaceae bacterium]|nr:ferredoxin [Streptosporangiaceae bacterium]
MSADERGGMSGDERGGMRAGKHGRMSAGGRGRRNRNQPRELRVNPVACQAHGVCIELLPELISADPWGYPVIAPGPVPPALIPLAERAANSCPTLALLLMSPD